MGRRLPGQLGEITVEFGYFQLSVEFLGKEETHGIYERKAAELEEQGRLTEAEQVSTMAEISTQYQN